MLAKNILIVLGVILAVWYIVASLRIVDYLQKKGQKINWFLLRLLLPMYAHRYKKLTLEESGRTGTLFYQWIISINVLLVVVILIILI